MQQDPIPFPAMVTIEDLHGLSVRAGGVIAELRKRMLLPEAKKSPPTLSSEKVASICGLNKGQIHYRVKNGAPPGVVASRGGRREFSLVDAEAWARAERAEYLRPKGAKAVTIAVAFFKGGVTKTTTVMTLAQGLSLLGHKILIIDMDPQGSLTTLNGLLPDSEITEEETLAPLFHGDQADVRYAIRDTYWPGISLIPAASALFGAEFALPARQMQNPTTFEFWNVLDKGLEPVRDDYDVILVDTPPSLAYTNIATFFAADGLIVPMTASLLDVASSAQFWHLFAEVADSINRKMVTPKAFHFVHVLMSKVSHNDTAAASVRDWISTVYGGKLLPVEIPLTTVTSTAAAEFATVFDVTKYLGDSRTYKRARDAYEALALKVEEQIRLVWAKKLQEDGHEQT